MPDAPSGIIYKSLRKKRIKVNGKRTTDGTVQLDGGDVLELYINDEFFEKGADIELTVSGDEICKECPNLKEGSCVSAGLVEAYDRKVLEACGLSEKAQMRFQEFVENVQKNVIESGKRVEICGNCQWNEICANKQSRWKRNK